MRSSVLFCVYKVKRIYRSLFATKHSAVKWLTKGIYLKVTTVICSLIGKLNHKDIKYKVLNFKYLQQRCRQLY